MNEKSPRKKWSKDRSRGHEIIKTPQRHERVAVAKQLQPPTGYEEYLLLLQQRNKMLKKVKLTDKEQIEKERKEKGFALYVNGANASSLKKAPTPSPRVLKKSGLTREVTKPTSDTELAINLPLPNSRSRSAPEKAQKVARKNWNASSINIQTARGEKMHLHAPDLITGNYSEDFEDLTMTSNDDMTTQNGVNADSDDDTIRESIHIKSHNSKASKKPGADNSSDDEDRTISDHVLLTLNDVTKLRKSLEMSRSVRESICKDIDEDSDIDEDITDVCNDSQLSAADVIVLEFAPCKSSPRKSLNTRQISTDKSVNKRANIPQQQKNTIDLKHSKPSNTPRPLSAVRKSSNNKAAESVEQRNDVLSALAIENERVDKYMKSKETHNKPRVHSPLMNSFMLETEEDVKDVEDRVLQMEPKQQRDLLKTLYQLENSVRPSSTALIRRKDKEASQQGKDTEVHKVQIELMSNWGHPKLTGLTEVVLLNECNERIDVNTSFLRLDGAKNCRGHQSYLFNNKCRTVKERNMFCCERSGQKPVSLSFRVEIPLGSQICKIKLWNYNKNLNDLNIGVKRLRLSIDDDILYDDDIDKGCGNQVFDYSHTIVLGSNEQQDNIADVCSSPSVSQVSHQEKTIPSNSANILAKKKPSNHGDKRQTKIKRLHHPDHSSVRKSDVGNSTEMWIPLSDTPEPTTRCETRILNRSSEGVELPVVDSDTDDESGMPAVSSTSNIHQPANKNKSRSSQQGKITPEEPPLKTYTDSYTKKVVRKPPTPSSKNSSANNSHTVSKTEKTAASRLPWMDNFESSRSLTQRSPSPKNANQSSSTSKPELLSDWIKNSASEPLRTSLDEMLEALDKWDPQSKEEKEELKTIFDEPVIEPTQSDGMPTQVGSEQEEANYRQTASRDMARRTNNKHVEKPPHINKAAARRKKWQQAGHDLEASWTSLDIFDKSHKGRLSMEGDMLSEYLKNLGTPSGIVVDADTSSKPNPSLLESISEDVNEQFIIPELPKGQNMVINIKSTWGDKYYVGLNGIELFAETGEPISISKITADPRDINVLSEYKNDPRVAGNLLDGVNRTRDDIHMWLAPFTEGANHFICLTFTQSSTVALLRIWNYNKSRIHSYRGAKDVEISLDGHYIFKGEIARACGGTQGGTEAFGDTILFTMSDEILDAVSRHDGQYEGGNFSDEWEDDVPYERPTTADKGKADRPHTSVVGRHQKRLTLQQSINTPPETANQPQPTNLHQQAGQMASAVPVSVDGTTLVYKATEIALNFTETWGDPHYLGLTGLEVVAKDGEAIPLNMSMLDAQPRDLHVLKGYEMDDRTLDKLIDGVNITGSDEHMWLIPYVENSQHILKIKFKTPQELVGLRFWNYNKSAEDTYRGAKTVHILLDGSPISPPHGFLIRKGPGNCYYDFAQELLFSDILCHVQLDMQSSSRINSNTDGEDPTDDYILSGNMPKGFVYQFHLLSSQGDLYYVGLNSIEFYDSEGKRIELEENNLAAYPESVNVLDGMSGDVRTPDKLICNQSDSAVDNMWLSPILPSITNRLFVIFDYPQTVSMIKIWNYSKTPSRGVKDFALLVDDLLVYNGALGLAKYGGGILPNMAGPQSYHTILFTSDEKIKNKVKNTVVSNTTEDVDIQLTNDNTIVSKPLSQLKKSADQALRPKTSLQKRPARRK